MRIELRGVRKRFERVEALKGVELAIPQGRRVALVGPNGSGKSTLIRAIMGLVRCDGEVLLDGAGAFDERERVAQRLAYVPQIAPQLAAPVSEIVAAVAATRGIDSARIAEVARRLDLELESVASRAFRHLSGGMKQKVLIAAAFAAPASLLILDEPTASLDASARERFFTLFDDVPPSTTLLLCSHRLEELRHLATHVVELDEGRVAFDGAADELLARRAHCVVEVHLAGTERDAWLRANGFRAGASGWWARTCDQREKLRVVPAVTEALAGDLRNLLVRDLEALGRAATGGRDA